MNILYIFLYSITNLTIIQHPNRDTIQMFREIENVLLPSVYEDLQMLHFLQGAQDLSCSAV